MRQAFVTTFIAAFVSAGQLPTPLAINPKRISADEMRKNGDVTLYRGNVTFHAGGVVISGERLDYRVGEWQFRSSGAVRVALARPAAEYTGDPLDPSRFQADDVRRDGETLTLHGKATLRLPNWAVTADDAVVDRAAGVVTVQGAALFAALKAMVTDNLGPMFLTSSPLGARAGAEGGERTAADHRRGTPVRDPR